MSSSSSPQEEQQEQIVKKVTKPCDLCGKVGEVVAVEMLPGNGILFECKHDDDGSSSSSSEDKKIHEWAAFQSLSSLRNIKIDRGSNPEIKCPKCTEIGVIKTERDDEKRPDRYSYRISHPDGHRCRMSGKNRDEVLKYLNRYIPDSNEREDKKNEGETQMQQQQQQKKHKHVRGPKQPQIVCPECSQTGSAAIYQRGTHPCVVHQHGDGKNTQHTMKTLEQRHAFILAIDKSKISDAKKRNLINKTRQQMFKEIRMHETEIMKILNMEGDLPKHG